MGEEQARLTGLEGLGHTAEETLTQREVLRPPGRQEGAVSRGGRWRGPISCTGVKTVAPFVETN